MIPVEPGTIAYANFSTDLWEGPAARQLDLLVVRKGAVLPERCVICNDASMKLARHSHEWHPTILARLAGEGSGEVHYWLCPEHERQGQRKRAFCMGGVLGTALVLGILVIAHEITPGGGAGLHDTLRVFSVFGGLCFAISVFVFFRFAETLRMVEVKKDGSAKLKGAGWKFLDSLPSVKVRD